MKELLVTILNFFGLACWVEVTTDNPRCTYYFGPFLTMKDAEAASPGYLEDLEEEKAQGIKFIIKRCKPEVLTVFDELSEDARVEHIPTFGGQISQLS